MYINNLLTPQKIKLQILITLYDIQYLARLPGRLPYYE